MATILFDIVSAKGHIHATLKIASLLKGAGHEVMYSLYVEYWQEVEKHGFQPTVVVPIPRIDSNRSSRNSTNQKLTNSTIPLELADFSNVIQELDPDLILLDEQNSFKAIYYQILKIPVIFFLSKPDTQKIEGVPPFTSYYLPNKSIASDLYVELLWVKHLFIIRYGILKMKILTRSNDVFSVCERIAKKAGLNFKQVFEYDRSFGFGVKGVPRLIISPKAFDFPHPEKVGVYRIGPLTDISREGRIDHPRYNVLLKKIDQLKLTKTRMIIYASMGTVSRYDLSRCSRFFKRLVKVADKNKNDLFILSTGKFFDINLMLPSPNNLLVFESVPQVDLLQRCDIMITHGGMNSITECVFCEVPMLVFPLSRNWDQPGNSARVIFHQLGLRGRIEQDSAEAISRKLNIIKNNYDYYKGNIIKMKREFELQNNSTEVVSIIESIIANYEKN